jgi:hypothetical protein
MIMRPRLYPLIAAALLAGCDARKPDWADQGQRKAVPAAACMEVEKGVDRLRHSNIDVTDAGEAVMPSMLWNGMAAGQHDQLLRTLAFHAACKRGAESDAQPVVVRGDDGTELVRRTISTRVDTAEGLRD